METKQEQKVPKTKATISSTIPIRAKRETRKKILQKLTRVNKWDYGRKLPAEGFIALAITFFASRSCRKRDAEGNHRLLKKGLSQI